MTHTKNLERLPYNVVLQRLGPALFGDEWIEKLTVPERMFYQTHGGTWHHEFLGHLYLTGEGDDRAIRAGLPEEKRAAYDRAKQWAWQQREIETWLYQRDIPKLPLNVFAVGDDHYAVVDRSTFEKAFREASFPNTSTDTVRAHVPRRKRSLVDQVRDWRHKKYPNGTAKAHKVLALECGKDLGRSVSDRVMRRASAKPGQKRPEAA